MTMKNRTIDTPPRDPRERAAWVKFQLELRAMSFASIARGEGVSQRAVCQALWSPSQYLEEAIARAIGLTPQALFPERFDASGNRLHRSRPRHRSSGLSDRNDQLSEAA